MFMFMFSCYICILNFLLFDFLFGMGALRGGPLGEGPLGEGPLGEGPLGEGPLGDF